MNYAHRVCILNLLILLALGKFAFAEQQVGPQVMLRTQVTPDTMLLGDRAELSVWASIPKGYHLQFPAIADTVTKALEVIGHPHVDTLRASKGMQQFLFKLQVTSFDSGTHVIPALNLLLVHNDSLDTISTLPARLTVLTIPRDPNIEGIHDIKPPLAIPYTFREVAPWVGLGLLLAALLALAILYYIRRKQNQPIFFAPKPIVPPHVTALKELEQIKEQKLWENENHKYYFSKLTDVLRTYIEGRFLVPALEQTSGEIIQGLKYGEHVDKKLLDDTQETLYIADLVKFARFAPTIEEKQSSYSFTHRFVTSTMPEEEPAKEEEDVVQDELKAQKEQNEDSVEKKENSN